jgi:hypothetical protein
MSTFNIGREFSLNPEGRFYTDGEGNGEDFRENHLRPRLERLAPNEKLEVIIDDDVDGYGSSFLTEGFAGIVKYGYMTSEELLSKLDIKLENDEYDFFRKKILEYIRDAKFDSEEYIDSRTQI